MMAVALNDEKNTRRNKWDDLKARSWLLQQAEMSKDGSFVVTTRNLAALWGWSKAAVSNFLKTMDLSGQITREVLPNNGGTRLTIAGQGASVVVPLSTKGRTVKNDSSEAGWSFEDIESHQAPPSKSLSNRLARAYHGIIYGEAGFEHCSVEHLDLIERALFGIAGNDNRCDLGDVAEPVRQAA